MLIQEEKVVTLKFINDILGASPSNKQFYEKYLLSKLNAELEKVERKIEKTKDEKKREELIAYKERLLDELANLPEVLDEEDHRLTVFYRTNLNGEAVPIIRAHQVLGFFKEAGNNFKDELGIRALKDKISRYVRVFSLVDKKPYDILLHRGKNIVKIPDGILERPILAMTMQGKRVSVIRSEYVKSSEENPVKITFKVIILKNKEVDFSVLETLLEYGKYCGIGQWRTGGYGSFVVESVK